METWTFPNTILSYVWKANKAMNDTKERMQDIGHAVDERIPEGFGFFVMVFPLNEPNGGRANYLSSCNRKDVIKCMKEFLFRCGEHENWMKDIE